MDDIKLIILYAICLLIAGLGVLGLFMCLVVASRQESIMAFSEKEAAFKYINEYQKETYDRITILVKKGQKEKIKQLASNYGMSLSEYIVFCINTYSPIE